MARIVRPITGVFDTDLGKLVGILPETLGTSDVSHLSTSPLTIPGDHFPVTQESASGKLFAGLSQIPVTTRCTWAERPSVVGNAQQTVLLTDVGVSGSIWISNGTDWVPLHPVTLASQHTFQRNADTDTAERSHFQLIIPGMLMPPNGTLEVTPIWSHPNSATTKTLKVTLGSAQLYNKSRTTTAFEAPLIELVARNARNAHLIPFNSTGLYAVANASSISTSAVDMSVDQTLTISSSWGAAGTGTNYITLERVRVRLIP